MNQENITWDQILELVTMFDTGSSVNASVRFGDISVELSKEGGGVHIAASDKPDRVQSIETASAVAPEGPPASLVNDVDVSLRAGEGVAITAPIVGVFYRAPSPGAEPFASPGDTVEADQTIGIIEVMKMMNPVTAGVSGKLLSFEVVDGEPVEFGQTLATVNETP